jgi:hypothetical protein
MSIGSREREEHEVLQFLRRIQVPSQLDHSGRMFIDHLTGTWQLLRRWRVPTAVSRAGLLHSAYSTVFYPRAIFSLSERNLVKQLIGRQAERLVFLFCIIDRPHLWAIVRKKERLDTGIDLPQRGTAAPLHLTPNYIRNLLLIESANIAEQSGGTCGEPSPWISLVSSWSHVFERPAAPYLSFLTRRISRTQDEGAVQKYMRAVERSGVRSEKLLDAVIDANPYVGEPYILRAVRRLENGDFDGSIGDAAKGAEILQSWAVAWDKRMSWEWWLALASRTLELAVGSKQPSTNFDSICRRLRVDDSR